MQGRQADRAELLGIMNAMSCRWRETKRGGCVGPVKGGGCDLTLDTLLVAWTWALSQRYLSGPLFDQ
jgi:hypothetical protein